MQDLSNSHSDVAAKRLRHLEAPDLLVGDRVDSGDDLDGAGRKMLSDPLAELSNLSFGSLDFSEGGGQCFGAHGSKLPTRSHQASGIRRKGRFGTALGPQKGVCS